MLIATCVDCQHMKYETRKVTGLLFLLLVPFRPWEDLSLDFIVCLPTYRRHTTILVVVEHFLKDIHLGILPTHHTSHTITLIFMDIVKKIHGMLVAWFQIATLYSSVVFGRNCFG